MPFWVLLLAWPLLNERTRRWQWLSVSMAAGGLLFILEPWQLHGNLTSSLLAVAGGLAWATSVIVAKRLQNRQQVGLLSLAAWQMLLGSMALAVLALLIPSKPIVVTGYFIGALAYNAIMATALAWLLWLFILHHLSAGTAGLSSLAVAAIGVLMAWFELGETPTNTEFFGMLLILAALAVLFALGRHRQ